MAERNKKNNLSHVSKEERELFLDAFFGRRKRVLKEIKDFDRDLFLEAISKDLYPIDKSKLNTKKPKSISRKRRYSPIDRTLDLHGMHEDSAIKAIHHFIDNAKREGLKTLLIIHGKGAGIIKNAAYSIAESNPFVDDYQMAPGKFGGSGAVLLKINQRKKR